MNETWALIKMDKYSAKIKPKRSKRCASDASIRSFSFVAPHKVGKIEPNTVWLSDIEIESDNNSICAAKGIVNVNTAFVQHPVIVGSKDHFNTQCAQDVNYQFCNLIVRSGFDTKYKALFGCLRKIKGFKDNILVTIVYNKIDLLSFMELDRFTMVLSRLKNVGLEDQRLQNINFKPLFAIEMDIGFRQNGELSSMTNVIIVPVYKTCHL